MNSTETTTPSLDAINDLDWWGLKYVAVRLALELDIFTTIAAGCHTLEEIAGKIRTSERGARILLDVLCPLGLLRKVQGVYFLTPTSEAFLVRGKPTCCADAYLVLWRSRDKLMKALRTGTATLDIPGPEAEEMWASYAAVDLLTWSQSAATAHERWTQLGITEDTRPGWLVLDAACGSGVGSFVLAQADPNTRVIAFDFPKVLDIASQVAENMGVREQVNFHPGNLLTDEFPDEQFDVVLFGAILYYFKPEDVIAVLRRAHHALKSDGLVVIRSLIADEERCQNEMALVLALELLHDAPHGEVYTFSEYKDFLETAGFTDVSQLGEHLISAKKFAVK
jgi:ubiquinone/menaquinone biosynthesis C-methylase UbiE